MVLLALSTGHKIGLAAVGAIFIAFALTSAVLIPRSRPDFPGRAGLRAFVLVTLLLFVAMMGAVTVFGKESEEASAEGKAAAKAEGGGGTVQVTAKDFRFDIAKTTFTPGSYSFQLKNDGPSAHDLRIVGPGVRNQGTPVIAAGKSASATVQLRKGTYDMYCSVPGHKQLGMDVTLKVA